MQDIQIMLTDYGLPVAAILQLNEEDERQIKKWGQQTHSIDRWMTIISEEHGELAKAICEVPYDSNWDAVAKEAIQLSTLALKMAVMAKQMKGSGSRPVTGGMRYG